MVIICERKNVSEQGKLIDHWVFRIIIKSVMVCKDTTTLLTYGAAITNHPIYVYRGTTSTYISYVSPEQTKQDLHQETLEAAGDDKGQ